MCCPVWVAYKAGRSVSWCLPEFKHWTATEDVLESCSGDLDDRLWGFLLDKACRSGSDCGGP